jgi:hypothetical protein
MQVGEQKLSARRSSTAPVGTARVIQALHTLARQHCVCIHAYRLLAQRQAQVKVLVQDTQEHVEAQWSAVCEAMSCGHVLIYHLHNHYSLVYAAREWQSTERKARAVRQLLIARPGQAPNRWEDFDITQRTLLKWSGYGILCVQRVHPHRERVVLHQS